MFGGMERSLATYQVETLSADFLVRGHFQPLGELAVFLNDRRRDFIRLDEVELVPLGAERQLRAVHRQTVNLNKHTLLAFSLPVPEEAQKVQILASKRPVVFYLSSLIVRGELHVNIDAVNEDLLDETRDFHPVTSATFFPVRNTNAPFTREVPLLFLNRAGVQGYHLHEE